MAATNAKYINSSNQWADGNLSTTSRLASINIPVSAGETYIIEAIHDGAIYAFLKSNTTVGNPVDFSDSLQTRVVLSSGDKVKITIPSDTTLLYCYYGRYNPQTYTLYDDWRPQLTKISSFVVQETGQSTHDVMSQKAVTDEVAVTTNTLEIDLSKLTQVTAFPSPSDNWIVSGTYKGVFVPIPSNKKYKIKANAEYQGFYCFLKTNSYSGGAVIDYATGCTRVVVPANAEVIDIAPSDARYLYINTYTTHNTTPQLVELIDEKSIKEIVSEAEVSEVYKHVNTWEIISEFTVGKYITTSQGVGNYCPMTTTDLSSMDCVKIDAVAGEKYRIVGVGGNNPRLWATIDKNTSTILAAFDGYIGSQYIPFDEIIEIEQDCWLIINVYNNTASPAYYNYLETPYSLQKVAWSITGN